MFTKRFIDRTASGVQSFSKSPMLLNQQFKYRTLGEIVALARVTNEKPLPTRAGVYIGDQSIPRDVFDRVDSRNDAMDRYLDAETQLKDAEAKIVEQKAKDDKDAYEKQIREKYQKSE